MSNASQSYKQITGTFLSYKILTPKNNPHGKKYALINLDADSDESHAPLNSVPTKSINMFGMGSAPPRKKINHVALNAFGLMVNAAIHMKRGARVRITYVILSGGYKSIIEIVDLGELKRERENRAKYIKRIQKGNKQDVVVKDFSQKIDPDTVKNITNKNYTFNPKK